MATSTRTSQSPQPLDDLGHDVEDVVDLGVGGRVPEGEAHGRLGLRRAQAHGQQDVARLERPAGARRARPTRTRPRRRGASGAPPGRRRRRSRWQLEATFADAPRLHRPRRARPSPPRLDRWRRSPSASRSRSRPTRRTASSRWRGGDAQGGRHAHDAGHVVGAGPPPALLRPPVEDRRRGGVPSRTTSAPTPLGPPNLWALTDTRSATAHSAATSSHPTAGHRVGVQRPPGGEPAHEGGHLGEGLHRADLVVHEHDRHQPDPGPAAPASASRSTTPTGAPPRRCAAQRRAGVAAPRGAPRPSTPPVPAPGRAGHRATARLSDSVPPEVNTTSPGPAPQAPRPSRRGPRRRQRGPGAPRVASPTGCRSARSGRAAWPPTPRGASAWWRRGPGTPASIQATSARTAYRRPTQRHAPPPSGLAHHDHRGGDERAPPTRPRRDRPHGGIAIQRTGAVPRPPTPRAARPGSCAHRATPRLRPPAWPSSQMTSPMTTKPSPVRKAPWLAASRANPNTGTPYSARPAQFTPGRKYRAHPLANRARRAPAGPGRPGPRSPPWCRSRRPRTGRGAGAGWCRAPRWAPVPHGRTRTGHPGPSPGPCP